MLFQQAFQLFALVACFSAVSAGLWETTEEPKKDLPDGSVEPEGPQPGGGKSDNFEKIETADKGTVDKGTVDTPNDAKTVTQYGETESKSSADTIVDEAEQTMPFGGSTLSRTNSAEPQQCQALKVDGQWNNWGPFGACSEQCGWGVMKRYRTFSNPAAGHLGNDCEGYKMEVKVCRVKRCSSSSYDIDFDTGFGSWTTKGNLVGEATGFIRRSGSGPTPATGPTKDYPSGSGSYAVWPGVDRMYNQKAQLVSPLVLAGEVRCLIFHYQLNGAQINPKGALSIYLKDVGGSYLNLNFDVGGHQGNHWKRAAVTIPTMSKTFTIEFEAAIGYDKRSDVAVDHIFLDAGTCPSGLEGCGNYHSSCKGWAEIGECVKNPVWMARECCKACSSLGDCINNHTSCSRWAEIGECVRNPRWMWPNCCDACSNTCEDYNASCQTWTDSGECKKNSVWMSMNCCKTCKAGPTIG